MQLYAAIMIGVLMALSPAAKAGENSVSPAATPIIAENRPEVVVYKTPYCGCCGGWAEHVEAHGYPVTTHDMSDLEVVKQTAGVPESLESCHTAIVDGYVIEGHVPAEAIDRLLSSRPPVKGLAVPGMPIGSPVMEGADPEPYDVMSFDGNGEPSVFMSFPAAQ